MATPASRRGASDTSCDQLSFQAAWCYL
jgi:hypothetical protein